MTGYFEIGCFHAKSSDNVGTLMRSAYQLGAAGVFTIGRRYVHQSSDTTKTWRHIPYRDFLTLSDMIHALPYNCMLVGVEMGGTPLEEFRHPDRAVYLLGAEDHGLPPDILAECERTVSLRAVRTESYNVAVAGSLVMYDRLLYMSNLPKIGGGRHGYAG